ncbi:Uma2 family endonuclease [Neorhodopirellula pilleata]|uniref:Putative restriction endonuclease domain-containing protein n=1 Tax=Neorhodopirellula pilleata TaxID=2714738 RepID=A0A5C6AH70_9BACT|nr:Uma2 family endonuclease [Neorhodopirellula pilleata]TWT98810.1 hypothetical protein Pla100_19760 [Neorhodopirellula pilleata]
MSTASHFQPISVRDYLDGEQQAKRKHEYVAGDIYAMAGGTVQHNRIASNATGALFAQLRGQRCQVFNSDMKVRVRLSSGTRFYYPDVSVVCQPNPPSETFQDAPVVIIEVVSDSTRRTDEYEKREAYLSIDSLCVYVLIEQNAALALVYRRADSGFDREVIQGARSVILLPEIGCELALEDVYQNVEFQSADPDEEA